MRKKRHPIEKWLKDMDHRFTEEKSYMNLRKMLNSVINQRSKNGM